MARHWPPFCCVFMEHDFSVLKYARNNLDPAILSSNLVNNPYKLIEQVWAINDLLYDIPGAIFMRDTTGNS